MSTFTEKITLANAGDISCAERGIITEAKIRRLSVDAMVDTGAWTLVINEETRAALGLAIRETSESTLADGATKEYALTEGIELRWKNRMHILSAVLVPNAKYILLGALPLEAMDLMVDPVDECLKGRHGDKPLHILC
jgi:predicted aspartyl protease